MMIRRALRSLSGIANLALGAPASAHEAAPVFPVRTKPPRPAGNMRLS